MPSSFFFFKDIIALLASLELIIKSVNEFKEGPVRVKLFLRIAKMRDICGLVYSENKSILLRVS